MLEKAGELELAQSRTLSRVKPGEDTRAEVWLEQPVPLTRRQYPLGYDSSEGSAGACSWSLKTSRTKGPIADGMANRLSGEQKALKSCRTN